MNRAEFMQELRKMRFEEAYKGWTEKRLSQREAAEILGVCDRTFRRYVQRFEGDGVEGLIDYRLGQVSHRRAPVDEVIALTTLYTTRYSGWNTRHFHERYQQGGGKRSYTWVKSALQKEGAVKRGQGKGKHRKQRARRALPGMMIHQDGSTHQWVPGVYWDLIVTMDDATNVHYSMFFVEQEGTASSFRGVREVIEQNGLFCSFYSDRGSHYWTTPAAGGKVDKVNLTQVGRALKQLGIEQIAAYSPEARGRSERMFRTHQERLVKELALHGITTMEAANRYLKEVYQPAFNQRFTVPAAETGRAFVPVVGVILDNILCEHFERTVGKDNCVQFETLRLQIPPDQHRMHYVKATVQVQRYTDGRLGVFHGPRCLARYDANGQVQHDARVQAA